MNHTEYMQAYRGRNRETIRAADIARRLRPIIDDIYTKAEVRFWSKVAPDGECRIFTGRLSNGYGVFSFGGLPFLAHRFAYIVTHGSVPPGMQLDHLCRTRACVNPTHLEAVTGRENILRGVGITAQCAKRTHCPKGHPYDRVYGKRRGRSCSQCQNASRQAWRARRVAS